MGIDLTHVYGLTEVYGPATVCLHRTAGRSWTLANAHDLIHARAFVTTLSMMRAC